MLKSPFLKRENQNTRARLRACSLKASWSISNDSVGVFPRRKQNFKHVLCSFKSHITISTGSQKLPSRKLTVRPISYYRKTSVSLLTVESVGNKHWRCPSPTSPRSAALRLVFFFGSPHVCIHLSDMVEFLIRIINELKCYEQRAIFSYTLILILKKLEIISFLCVIDFPRVSKSRTRGCRGIIVQIGICLVHICFWAFLGSIKVPIEIFMFAPCINGN